MAKRLDISIPAFSKIETGITDINLSRLNQISKLFDMSVVQLLASDDREAADSIKTELADLGKRLQEREGEIIKLQKKVIDLYEQLHEKTT